MIDLCCEPLEQSANFDELVVNKDKMNEIGSKKAWSWQLLMRTCNRVWNQHNKHKLMTLWERLQILPFLASMPPFVRPGIRCSPFWKTDQNLFPLFSSAKSRRKQVTTQYNFNFLTSSLFGQIWFLNSVHLSVTCAKSWSLLLHTGHGHRDAKQHRTSNLRVIVSCELDLSLGLVFFFFGQRKPSADITRDPEETQLRSANAALSRCVKPTLWPVF